LAKRVRGSHSTHRPGGLAPAHPRGTAGSPGTPAGGVTDAQWDTEIDAAIDSLVLETTEVTIEDPVMAARPASRARRRVTVKADSLDARVAAENIYVRQDLRRIGVVSAILVTGLAVAWILFVALDLLNLY
jgi:hypothetical protein